MLLTALLVSIPSLLCYANGFEQFGTRHYLQVFPFLLVLMAMSMRRPDRLDSDTDRRLDHVHRLRSRVRTNLGIMKSLFRLD